MCMHCAGKYWGLLVLVLGIALLLQDLGKWAFWNISPWTLVFLLAGIGMVTTAACGCCVPKKGKKR